MLEKVKRLDKYNGFARIVKTIVASNPFQMKSIEDYLIKAGEEFWNIVDELEPYYTNMLEIYDDSGSELAKGFNKLCFDMMQEQKKFEHARIYSESSFKDVNEKVYQNKEVINSYLKGLVVSQLLWPNHFGILSFFRNKFIPTLKNKNQLLEIGVGHGLFFGLSMQHSNVKGTGIDISEISLKLARTSLNALCISEDRYELATYDIQQGLDKFRGFDALIAGEIIEHIEDPLKLLGSIKENINTENSLFFTTCANCPAIDHIYQFHSIDEIRSLLNSGGMKIREDIVLPLGKLSIEEALEKKITINYAAICIIE